MKVRDENNNFPIVASNAHIASALTPNKIPKTFLLINEISPGYTSIILR
jgi:hypothetical protein